MFYWCFYDYAIIQFTGGYTSSLLGECRVHRICVFRAKNGAHDLWGLVRSWAVVFHDFTTILRVGRHDASLVVHIDRWVSKLALGQQFGVFCISIESLLSLFSFLTENFILTMNLYNLLFCQLLLTSTCLFLWLKHSSPVIDLAHLFHFESS